MTIGYGHLIKSGESFGTISHQRGLNILSTDVAAAENAVRRNISVDINQGQFDALTDFAYNVGGPAFARSSVVSFTNSGNFEAAANSFSRYNMANHIVMPGLTIRRGRDSNLYSYGEY